MTQSNPNEKLLQADRIFIVIPLTISDSQHNHRLLSVILKLARRSDAQHPRTAQRADGHRDIFVHGIHDPPTAVRPLGSLSTDGQTKSRASAGALLQILITSLIFCGDSCYFACSPLTGNHRMAVLGLMQPSMNSSTHPSIPISSLFLVAALKSAAHRPSFHPHLPGTPVSDYLARALILRGNVSDSLSLSLSLSRSLSLCLHFSLARALTCSLRSLSLPLHLLSLRPRPLSLLPNTPFLPSISLPPLLPTPSLPPFYSRAYRRPAFTTLPSNIYYICRATNSGRICDINSSG